MHGAVADAAECLAYEGVKQLRIRDSITHEAAQRDLGVEKYQAALEHRPGVGSVFCQVTAECAAVLQGGNHQEAIAPSQASLRNRPTF